MNLNRYRILEDGSFTFHTFKEGQTFNQAVWLENRGNFQLKECGTPYTYYLPDIVEGKYLPDTAKEAEQEALKYKTELKFYIQKAIDTMRVELVIDDITYGFDGDEVSQARLDKASRAALPDDTSTIKWRLYDNSEEYFTQVQLFEAFTKASITLSHLWFCRTKEEVLDIVSVNKQWLAKFNPDYNAPVSAGSSL